MWVTFIVEYKIQPIMCNIYRGIQNTTYYVQHLWWNSKYNLLCVTFIVEFKIQPITYNIHCGIQTTTYNV